jgi:hypothetical protein
MTVAILAPKAGRNSLNDTHRIGELSNAGKPWRNSGNTFHGEPVVGPQPGRLSRMPSTGQMPEDEVAELRKHSDAGDLLYVIYSYATVIAYKVRGHGSGDFWAISEKRYSSTTSQQQGKLYVLTMPRHGYDGPDPS